MTDSIRWHRYDTAKAKAILGGATIRTAITATGTVVGVALMVYGLVNLRQIGLFFLGFLFFVCFGIFLLIFRNAQVTSRQSFGRLTGNLVGFDERGIHLEPIMLPWEGIARIATVDRAREVYEASTPTRMFGTYRLANALAFTAGQGQVSVSIIVTHGHAARAALSQRDRSFIGVPKKSALPEPLRGHLIFMPDVVMDAGEVELLLMALQSGAESRGIPFYRTDSVTDFTTKNYAAMGITL
jgi:hypothetical protein